MNVLVLGHGKGSWQMRGQQLGAAVGARVTSAPMEADWKWASVVVLIKRAGAMFAEDAHRYGVPIIWDAVDFWRQPWDNDKREPQARAILNAQIAAIRPVVTIGSTLAMAEAAGGEFVPHHSWAGLKAVQPQEKVGIVAYQGNPVYLGQWRAIIAASCRRRGWLFTTDLPDLWRADILVALRDGPWDGWMCRQWKSGVKLVNAVAAGRPVITQASAAFKEIGGPGWAIETEAHLAAALDNLTTLHARTLAYEACLPLAKTYTLPVVAEQFRGILCRVHEARCVA